MKTFCLYSVRNIVNGKGYIGQTTRRDPATRWREHQQFAALNSSAVLCRAIRKYGANNFTFEPVMLFASQAEADEAEVAMIAACGTRANGYNVAVGGLGGSKGSPSAETRAKMSAAHSTPEAVARKRAFHLGRKRSPEAVAKMKAAQSTPEAIARKREALTGLKRSPETCAKIKAVQNSPEIRAKLDVARRKFRLSPEHAAKLRASAYTPEANAKRAASLRKRKVSTP